MSIVLVIELESHQKERRFLGLTLTSPRWHQMNLSEGGASGFHILCCSF